jgi:penicillin-binding protein 1A
MKLPVDQPVGAGFFLDAANTEATRLLRTINGDLVLQTTLDPQIQAAAESVIAKHLTAEGKAKHVSQAALVAMAPDGAILAMVGGLDYDKSQFNRTMQAERQAGSLFKLFVYLAALKSGLGPDNVLVDQPVRIGNWAPENYEGRYSGPVSLRQAFAQSINSIAVQLSERVGVKSIVETAHALGIKSTLPEVPSLALGTADVNLLEMVRAYAAVAFNGNLVEPYAVREIRRGDQIVFRKPPPPVLPAVDAAQRAAMLDLLGTVVRDGTAKAAQSPLTLGGKTGTTQDYRDAWFIGFTSGLIIGVWVGNDDNSPMKGVPGGDLPARIWHDLVTTLAASNRLPSEPPPAQPMLQDVAAQNAAARPADPITGTAKVIDTATLQIGPQTMHLFGVDPLGGTAASDFARYLGDRTVDCSPAPKPGEYRCSVAGHDLASAVLFNGGGHANGDATPELRAAEAAARTSAVGIWRRR